MRRIVTQLHNALLAAKSEVPQDEPVKVRLRRVVVGTSQEGLPMYQLIDLGEQTFPQTHPVTYPREITKRGDLSGVEVLEELSRGPGSPVWRDSKGRGLPDAQVWEALLEACVELSASGGEARKLSLAVAVALSQRKGASPDPMRLP